MWLQERERRRQFVVRALATTYTGWLAALASKAVPNVWLRIDVEDGRRDEVHRWRRPRLGLCAQRSPQRSISSDPDGSDWAP